VNVQSEGTYVDGQCCYEVTQPGCITGRPMCIDGVHVTAALRTSANGWAAGREPDARKLTAEERTALAEAWARDGLMEHASIACFARLSLELAAFGAPADLMALAHRAALDEVRHAELCFSLASAYAGHEIGPGPLPLGGRLELARDLSEFAVAAVKEGCIGETLASLVAAAQLERAEDAAARAALRVIARDEAGHAELAWRTVAWAIRVGGPSVRSAVARAFAEATRSLPKSPSVPAGLEAVMAAHGRLAPEDLAEHLACGLEEVVLPAAARLLEWEPNADRLSPPANPSPSAVGAGSV
jgi:hypothetical protein